MLVPGSLTVGATFELPMPADCKAPDIALEINSLSSVGLKCEVDAVVSGKTQTDFLICAVLRIPLVLFFVTPGAWSLV